MALAGYKESGDDRVWARQVFFFSTITISALSVMMAVDGQVPAHIGWML
jgi:protoheme IX farnesyltransferase